MLRLLPEFGLVDLGDPRLGERLAETGARHLETFAGEARHSVTHRSADAFNGRRVLIVGAGNSGVDIACDAARSAQAAFLSVRRGYRFVPKHVFGVPTDLFFSGSDPEIDLAFEAQVMPT